MHNDDVERARRRALRTNFGLYFSWWNRWMGTEHPEYQAHVAEIAARARADRKPASRAITTASLLVFATAGAVLDDANAQPRSDIAGRWATQGFGSIVEFRACTEVPQTMCGRIVWLWEANDGSGRTRTDHHNPDRALRTRSLIGIEIVRGLRETASEVWSDGALYNPDDGRTYDGEIRLKNGTLELQGCALLVFCQTQTWRRPEDVIEAVKAADQ